MFESNIIHDYKFCDKMITQKMKWHFLSNSRYIIPSNILSLRTDIEYNLSNLNYQTAYMIPIFTINTDDLCYCFLCISYEVDKKTNFIPRIYNIIPEVKNIINPKLCCIQDRHLTSSSLYEYDKIRYNVDKKFVLNILKKCLKTCKNTEIIIFNRYYTTEEFINFKINELLYDITADMRYKYSARKIQRIWRDHITNPAYNICKRRLLNEFNSIF